MKKRIISIVLSVIMLICIIPISSALADDPISVIVSADKTSVYRGDTVVFTVSIGAVEHLMGAEFKVDVPMGMTYIAGSATVADGLKETLGCQAAEWTESSKKFTMYGEGDYSSNSPTKFLTFSCTIDMTATGSLVPNVYDEVVSNTNFDELPTNVNIDAATVTIAIPATGISLDKTTLNLASGAEGTLSATVTPNDSTDKISWESSDSTIASVDENGKVTAHKVGTAIITVTAGKSTGTCTVTVSCGHNKRHDVSAQKSTCLEQGWEEYSVCDECEQLFDKDGKEISEIPYLSPANHIYTEKAEEQYLKSAATCKAKAVYYKSCSVCGEKSTETFEYGEFDPENHKHTEIRDAEDATCCEAGYTGDTWCTDCNNKIETGKAVPPTGNHVDVDGKWETDGTDHWHTCYFDTKFDITAHSGGTATCHDQAICEVCGVAYGALDADNHVYEVKEVVAPTCTEKGFTTYKCKYDENEYKDNYVDALGHKVVEWTVTKEATAEESGTITGECTVCGDVITVETGKLTSKVEGDSAKVEAVGDTTLYENIKLKTDKVGDKLSDTDKADMQAKIEALKLSVDNIEMAEIFDISLFLRYTAASQIQYLKYEPNGKIRITMEVPEAIFKNFKNVKLLHFLDDGTVEAVDYTLDGSKAVFETESLSYFAFAGTPIVTETGSITDNGTKNENNGQASSPKTGDSSNPIVWIAVLLVSALTVGTVSVYSRKKNCRACKK